MRKSEAQLKKAQHYTHIGNWTWNVKAKQLDWSDEMFWIFGLERETFPSSLETVIAQAVHPDDRLKVKQANLSVIEHKQPVPLEYRVIWPDQSVHVVWAEPGEFLLDEAGNPSLISGTVQDITERKIVEEKLVKSYENLQKTLNDAISTMVKIVEMRDPYTAGHQQKVADLATAIAGEMKLEDARIDNLRMAAIIHDIGKIYVPSDILSKPGGLSDIEFSLIRTHSQGGYDIVKSMDFPCNVAKTVLQHHERLDGSGYPNQLKSEDTLLEAKILAVADVIEAMASHRPYRAALGIDKALEEISKNKGRLYDPGVVDTCLKLFNSGRFEFKSA